MAHAITHDLADLLVAFDELLPSSDEELKQYFLKFNRPDGITVQLSFDAYEGSATILVRCNETVMCSSVGIMRCTSINVVDAGRKIIEVIGNKTSGSVTRCIISLTGDHVLIIESISD